MTLVFRILVACAIVLLILIVVSMLAPSPIVAMPVLPLARCKDCGRKTALSPRCAPCRQQFRRRMEARRLSRQERGLDAEYERNRAIVLEENLRTHDGLCNYCWERQATTADHRRARAVGGTNDTSNLVPACTNCNARKGAKAGPPPAPVPV